MSEHGATATRGVTMNRSEIDVLFARTLVDDGDAEDAWSAIHRLRLNGCREIFDRAAAWCESEDPRKRGRAADVLCQLRRAPLSNSLAGETERLFPDESYRLIAKMLETEQDPLVLDSAISALGHLRNRDAIPQIFRFQDHPDDNVRFAVSFSLCCFPDDPRSVAGLLKLTRDSDAEVRDWAVFGLGVLGDADTPEIREALLGCLEDADEDVSEESAVGLGRRQDQRVISRLRAMLDDPEISPRILDAVAGLLGLKEKDVRDWTAADCRSALADRFKFAR
jgi:HEAT repeat protein